jgi:predicted NUDIX family NTP pyrophosphohydrolase
VPARSAGILLHRRSGEALELLLVHPGGPIWARKDLGAWSLPKGEYGGDEDPQDAARREFAEELGSPAPEGELRSLGEVRLRSGKRVLAWAIEGDLDVSRAHSNTFELEWPPRSGRRIVVPEVDRAEWFSPAEARRRLSPRQVPFVDRLLQALAVGLEGPDCRIGG